MNGVDLGVAAGITTLIQLGALALLVLTSIAIIIFLYKKIKAENSQKTELARMKQKEELEQRNERLNITNQYARTIADLTHALNITNDNYTKLQEVLSQLKVNFDERLLVLTNEYISELDETMTSEIISLTLDGARDKIILFCSEVIANNHIMENQIEVEQRLHSFISQQYAKDVQRFKLFRYQGITLDKAMDLNSRDMITKGVKARILNMQDPNVMAQRNLNNFIRDSFESFKVELREKVLNFKKK